MWLIFLALHLVGLAGYNLLLRKSLVQKTDRFVLATIMQTGIALPMLGFLLISPPEWGAYEPQHWLFIAIIVLLVMCLHWTNVKALQYLEASVYSVLYNLRIIFTTVLGIAFLNETVVPLRIAGGLLIFLAVLTVRQKGRKELTVRGLQWGIAAAVTISILNVFEKRLISDIGFTRYAVPVMLLAAVLMWLLLLLRRQKIPVSTFKQPATIKLMVLRALSAYGFTLAFNAGGILSVSTYVSSLSVIIIVTLGVIFLGEKDYLRQKAIATGLAVMGLTAIFISSI